MLSPLQDPCWAQTADLAAFPDDAPTVRLSSRAEMTNIIESLIAALPTSSYSPREIFGLRWALEEALVNSLKHGHRHDPAKQVTLRYCINPEFVLVEIQDQGPGFDPAQVPDPTACENLDKPSGRGLLLIQNFTSWVRFNERGNCITFCKYPARSLSAK
jgi:serine/threonine-protein kinase RsbW